MQNHNHVIGIDVSKEKLDVCAIFDGKPRKKVVKNNESGFKELQSWTSKLALINSHICMESTGCYSNDVAVFFHEQNFKVSVINPLQIKSFRRSKMVRQKTDSSDAEIIAEFCLQNNPRQWTPKSRENKELHEINVRIDFLKTELTRVKNTMEKKALNNVVKQSIDAEIEFIEKQIDTLGAEAVKIVENNERLQAQYDIFTSIKGVGTRTALTILANMPDVNEFESAKQYAAFAGVTPQHNQSGTSVKGKSRISKIGSKKIRKGLYMSALSIKNHNLSFKKFVEEKEKKGKPPKVIIVAIMRKMMHIFYGMLKNNAKFDEKLAFAT